MWIGRLLFAAVIPLGVLSTPAADAHRPSNSPLLIVAQAEPRTSEQAGRNNESYDQLQDQIRRERDQTRATQPGKFNGQVPTDPCFVNPKLPQCDLLK
jgi:hypothetical protein